ncbi:hypothetical protein ACFW2K_22495 [Streptomyces nigra]|uniref:hypothetical protein n=1 Tax=Streptomyces nigra TaxID=1827580 RepID=UPI0036962BA6
MQTRSNGTPEAAQTTPSAPRQTRSGRVGRATVSVAVALFAAVGTTVAIAPAASAVDGSRCNSSTFAFKGHINTNSVNLRSGPGTSYKSKGLLSKGTRTHMYCYYKAPGAKTPSWEYIKVTSGPNKSVKGWVRGSCNDWW